ncbi:mechanosensitive ion channel family protein, partial [Patescibacteria group bacterium]|nr:mechanosensitive ion channel family protein [Patescibacteria group bacterium]
VPVLVGIEEFADSAITVKILGKVMPGKQWEIMRAYREILKIELDKAGIEIPYPHQVEIQRKESSNIPQ